MRSQCRFFLLLKALDGRKAVWYIWAAAEDILPELRYLQKIMASYESFPMCELTVKGPIIVAKMIHWSAVNEPPAGTPISFGSRPR